MKIAFVNIYQDSTLRGGEVFVAELSSRLKNHELTILTSKRKLFNKRWPVLWRLFLDPQGLYIGWFTLKLLPKLISEKYDIVIPLNGGWQPAIVRIITWLTGGKMIIAGQSGIGWDDRNNLWSFPDAFVALTKKAEMWAKRVNPFVKVVRIPNGVDLNKFKPIGKKYDHKLIAPAVLAVGAYTTQKRLDLVIKAVSQIKEASLLLVGGGGELETELNNLGKKLLPKKFKMINVSHDEMPAVYRSCDVFTLVSASSEAFGIVFVEAMASGLPVVAIDDEQRKEVVGSAGFFVEDPYDSISYSKAIRKALDSKWGTKPRSQSEKFDWDKIVEEYEILFKSLTINH